MSTNKDIKRLTIRDLQAMKGVKPIVSLTAYTAPMAKLLDPHVDLFIVGDSLGMTLYGMESTLPVTMDMMIAHGSAVVRASERACVLVDMPFGSYQESKEQAYANAARILKETGAQCVKIEGGSELADTYAHLSSRGIPVMAHIGLMPQHVQTLGGYKYQGRDDEAKAAILQQALEVERAGAFALLLEGLDASLAESITLNVSIPTIGIGASPACNGQVLVTEDMLGLFERTPKFVKTYANIRDEIENAVSQYKQEVESRSFPTADHCFGKTN
jgi:3-methyl-2-oxobutanoate hydroxymethyltransferase